MKKKILLFLLLAKLNKHKNLKLEIDNFRKDFENIEVEIHEMTNLLKINTEDASRPRTRVMSAGMAFVSVKYSRNPQVRNFLKK